jgi:hypothetical protein
MVQNVVLAAAQASAKMQWDVGNITILIYFVRSQFERKRDEATQQIAVPNGIPSISGKCQPYSDAITSKYIQYMYIAYTYDSYDLM